MGCLQSKVKVAPEPPIVGLEEPQEPPQTDLRLPLDARQVFRLKKNWKGIKRKLTETGIELFIRCVFFYLRVVKVLNGFNVVYLFSRYTAGIDH